ncbi:thiamine pyrophosphate-binding protein [Fodinicurvata sp. EGI_FJ10296]|uniref:thiamine pyrophosphate-binding protein n=1 Tax=Fodinicurvata sp. EGI_FJ10296 TaxID=3231908 RepID=UPI0034538DCE
MKVADYLVAFLAACGVRHIYGYPGSPLVPLLGALQRQDTVQWVLMRHENAAALAAAAEAKLTGRLAVCMATSGPGALQAVCGVVEAQLDRAPLLALTGVVSRDQQGHWDFQDVDQTSLYNAILPRSVTCASSSQLVALLRNLIGFAIQNQGAAHLALPVDILDEDVTPGDRLFDLSSISPPCVPVAPGPDRATFGRAAAMAETGRSVIVVGRRAGGAGASIEALAEALGVAVVSSFDGKGIVDESHPHYLGVLGIFGYPAIAATKRVVEAADTVIAFGVDNLKPFLADGRNMQCRRLIQCSMDSTTASLDYAAEMMLLGPLADTADGIAAHLSPRPPSDIIERLAGERLETMDGILDSLAAHDDLSFINPLDFLFQLNGYLDQRHSVVVDTGSHTLWVALFLRLKHRQPFLVSSRLGTMGFSLPALIAAQLSDPSRQAVGICGDGGFGMVGMELATVVQHRLPIVLIIVNNGVLQNVYAQQAEPYGTTIHNPDFVAMAAAFGADGAVIDGMADVDAVLNRAFAVTDRPFVIDLRCSPALLAPLSKWETAMAQDDDAD